MSVPVPYLLKTDGHIQWEGADALLGFRIISIVDGRDVQKTYFLSPSGNSGAEEYDVSTHTCASICSNSSGDCCKASHEASWARISYSSRWDATPFISEGKVDMH